MNKNDMNQVTLNEKVLITIKRIGINGEGIGYYKRQAIFVENALPGEEVEVQIVNAQEKFAFGVITKIKKSSPDRVEPKCKCYGKCGGCQLQHLAYPKQLEEKKNMLIEAFNRYYNGDVSKIVFRDTIGMENPWQYRNKASLPTRHDGEKVVTGMYAKDSNMLVYIDDCPIENENVSTTRKKVLDILTKENIDVYNPKTKTGSLKYLVVRAFPQSKDAQVTFILNDDNRRLIHVLKKLPVKSANYSINSDSDSIEIFGPKTIYVNGCETIEGKLGNLSFNISPRAFFQLNTEQTTVLYEQIRKAAKLTKEENVLDCYCGIGSIGMYLAPYCNEVRGIDTNKQGIINANDFAKMNNMENVRFYSGDILPHLHNFEHEGWNIDTLVVDPPRKGMELNVLNYIKKSNIKKIIYVSCNPATLAKNINHLQKEYSIKYVTPIDMFPQTSNVECVVCLERR